MKVCIALDHRKRDISNTGKGFFAKRLICEFEKRGIAIVPPEEHSDIDLGIGRWQYVPKATKKILRLGAAHIDSHSEYKIYNARKLESLKMADGVIYQSEFSKKVCDKFIGKTDRPFEIINNGSDIKKTEVTVGLFNHFLAATRDWTPQKNLKDILKSFIEANNPHACLWVAGITHGIEKKYSYNNIKFIGLVDQRELDRLYSVCDAMINIVYADACPNNVVEALCRGCWILTSNSGGTQELLREGRNGNVLPLYKNPYDYGLVDLSHRIKINREPLVSAFTKIYAKHEHNDYLNIENIADKYIKFFERVLG